MRPKNMWIRIRNTESNKTVDVKVNPHSNLPVKVDTKVETKVTTEVLRSKEKMLPQQFVRAKKALNFLKYGAPAYQKSPEYSIDVP
jgi:N-acetylmuramic acid 6-phosphate (MurNAc-6-P) etherase